MSDAEHELVKENRELRRERARVRAIAIRALQALIDAQEAIGQSHEGWIDAALQDLAVTKAERA